MLVEVNRYCSDWASTKDSYCPWSNYFRDLGHNLRMQVFVVVMHTKIVFQSLIHLKGI